MTVNLENLKRLRIHLKSGQTIEIMIDTEESVDILLSTISERIENDATETALFLVGYYNSHIIAEKCVLVPKEEIIGVETELAPAVTFEMSLDGRDYGLDGK